MRIADGVSTSTCCRLGDLPLYGVGVSAGSAFVLKMPWVTKVRRRERERGDKGAALT